MGYCLRHHVSAMIARDGGSARQLPASDPSARVWRMKAPLRITLTYVRRHHLAIIAVFMALTSTAYAASLARNSVRSKHIKNGEVKTADIAANAVTGARVSNGALQGEDVKDGTLAGADVLDGGIATADLAAGAVTPAKQSVVPAVRVQTATPTNIPNNTSTKLSFANEAFDTADMHSPTTNPGRLTAPVSGVYMITGAAIWDNSNVGYRQIQFFIDGAVSRYSTEVIPAAADTNNNSYVYQTTSTPVALNAGQYVEMEVFQNSGGPLGLFGANDPSDTNFSLTWIGPK